MIELLVPLLVAALATTPSQEGAPPASSEPAAGEPGAEAALPPAHARWLDEVEALREAGNLAGARAHLALLFAGRTELALEEAPDEVAFAVLERVDELAETLGELAVQRRSREERLHRLSASLPPDHPELLDARRLLATTLATAGDLRGAHALLEDALAACERSLTEDEPVLLRARQALAATLHGLGDREGARELQEAVLAAYQRTLPAGHPDLLRAQGNLAVSLKSLGDLDGARTLEDAVLAAREQALPADSPDLLLARANLAATLYALGELDGARALQEAVLEAFERTLPGDHPDLLKARVNLAATRGALGDHDGARALEEAVLEAFERTLPPEHPDLLLIRANLAASLEAQGDLRGARALREAVLEARLRTLPLDHPDLLDARERLADTLSALGELAEARAVEEVQLETLARARPPDHPQLLGARARLAATMFALGDLRGARALQEQVLAARARTLPPDHSLRLDAVTNLAATLHAMGELAEARALQEAALAGYVRALPPDHPRLHAARGNLAGSLSKEGEHAAARALYEESLAGYERTLPPDHPERITARQNLAGTLYNLGELAGARAHYEAVLEVRERLLPPDHPDLLVARGNLAATLFTMGALSEARAQGFELARGVLRRLEGAAALSPREARELAGVEARRSSVARFLTAPRAPEPPAAIRFALAETRRAIACRAGAATGADATVLTELSELRSSLGELISGGPRPEQSAEAFAAEVASLTLERDRLERELRAALVEREAFVGVIRAAPVARALEEGAAAVGFVRSESWSLDPDTATVRSTGDVIDAHVLRADGSLVEMELGPADELAELARDWREAIGAPVKARGAAPVPPGAAPLSSGAGPVSSGAGPGRAWEDELAAGRRLRARILDPVLAAAGDARRISLCLDDLLFTLPIDALPLEEDDARLGDRVRLVHEVSFARLLGTREVGASEASALLFGDVDYGARELPGAAEGPPGPAASAPVGETRGAPTPNYAPLPETGPEARAIAENFREVFDRDAGLLARGEATKAAFHALAPGTRYLHVATHGWFAPESVPSTLDPRSEGGAFWSPLGARETVTGLAPMTLCGLAFAGANRGRDSLGRVPGILTAEELAGVDLRACDLAVLSACETNVGIRRAGQGIQSLQTALHAAGARSAITSLWKVDDAATRKLFERFYTHLWVEGLSKSDALWKAKTSLREEGHPVRDWAAWVLSGDPE